MHAIYKASSSTTKVRAVFDASAKSSNDVSLNDTLLVGPTVHPKLIEVLLRFRMHPVALTVLNLWTMTKIFIGSFGEATPEIALLTIA